PDRPDWARRDAELAFDARVVVDGPGLLRDLGVDEDRAEQYEVAEFRVDDIPVDTHPPQAGGHGDRLVADDPGLAGISVHLHGKAHRWVDRLDSLRLERGDDPVGDLVDVLADLVELQIGDRSRRAAHRLAVHPADDADE